MQRIVFFLLVLVAFCAPRNTVAQEDVFGLGTANSYQGNSCSYQTSTVDEFSWKGFVFRIHEDRQNLYLKGSPVQRLSRKKYVYLPFPAIDRLAVVNNSLWVTLTRAEPRIQDVSDRLRKTAHNPYLTAASIRPACVIAIAVKAGDYVGVSYTAAGSSLHGAVVEISFPSREEAEAALRRAKGPGGDLMVDVVYNMTDLTHAFLNINVNTILDSDAYQRYVSPVKGRIIKVDKAVKVSDAIVEELEATSVLDEELTPEERNRFREYFMEYILGARRTISWEDLAKGQGAATRLEDYNEDLRYRSDVINQVKQDAKLLTKDQWCKKYTLTTDNGYDTISFKKKTSSGGGGFMKIKLNGSHASERRKENRVRDSHHHHQEDCGHQDFEQTENFEFQGQVYHPKGITGYEVIDLRQRSSGNKSIDFIYPRNHLRNGGMEPLLQLQYLQP